MLGKILAQVRDALNSEYEYEQWLQSGIAYTLVENKKMLPRIEVDVYKDGKVIETIMLEGKALYTFGCNPNKSNVILLHASISRIHAAFIVDQKHGAMVVDLLSKASTYHSEKKLNGLQGTELKIGDSI